MEKCLNNGLAWIVKKNYFCSQNFRQRQSPLDKMLDLLRGLKSLVKLSHVQIDSSIFRLHYTITVMACLAFSLLVTARQYVGNPIDCVHTKDIPEVRRDGRCPVTASI